MRSLVIIVVFFVAFIVTFCLAVKTMAMSNAATVVERVSNILSTDPLRIEYLRRQEYPGREFTIEEELEKGSNYSQFIVSYRSEGLKIYALLTVPDGTMPDQGWPAIIVNHGDIPPDTYQTTEKYVPHVRSLASRGYVVLKPDYRGHGKSEGVAINAYSVPDYTIDVLNAASSLRQFAKVDPDRIGLWGHSTGGHIVVRAMVVDKKIKAGVIWGGVVGSYENLLAKWPSYWELTHTQKPTKATGNPKSDWRSYLQNTYGNPNENPASWQEISATSYLSDIAGPIQLHHAKQDTWVPSILSEDFYNALQSNDKYAELYTYQSTDHNLIVEYDVAMRRSLAFFNTHVKNHE
jgi:uncharacterized protein